MPLALHGAMYTEEFPHGDEEIVRRVRAALGPEVPLVVTHDFHANISPGIVELTDVPDHLPAEPASRHQAARRSAASISWAECWPARCGPAGAGEAAAALEHRASEHLARALELAITAASIELERRPGIGGERALWIQYTDVRPYCRPSVPW